MTFDDEMGATQEDKDLIERRKSPDLTPREFLRVTELQNRAVLFRAMADGPERQALVAESLTMRDEIAAIDMETVPMSQINSLNQRLIAFNKKALAATKANPR